MLSGALLFAEGMREEEKQAYCEKIESLVALGAGKSRSDLGKIPGLTGTDTPRVEIPYSDASHRDSKLTIYYNLSPTKTFVDYVSIRYTSRLTGNARATDLDYFFIQAAHFLIYYNAYTSRINRGATGYVYHGDKHTGRLVENSTAIILELDKKADVDLFSNPQMVRYIETQW
jgi:hypothetical protein